MSPKTMNSQREKPRRVAQKRFKSGVLIALLVLVAVLALGVIFFLNTARGTPSGNDLAGQYPFQVGNPGPGAQAPEITLPSTAGGTFTLSSLRGKTVLLYFQEGLTCQPCWDQLTDIQTHQSALQALGINQIVSITTDPLAALKQKVADSGLAIPVLSDPELSVSQAYTANSYGMMGSSRDGHTFVLVGPTGEILWRADYGGAPKYIMDVPVANLVADIRAGLKARSS
ncbi:MAG: redoxin domain-containing protein [Chloroflexi bacterium]|nr:MAG: redoxin domain-containing protein [Chloroflexota bacterium]